MLHMSQNDYKLEIFESLLTKDKHIRGLAKDLGTNQTTISRKIQELYDDNIVDFRQEGKNKVYFLKKNLEAKQYASIVETHKTLEAIKKYPRLRRIIDNIKENKNISLAVIFGSYAKGTATKESDIDLYIETTDRKIKEETELIDTKLSVKIGEYDKKNILIKEIEKNHIIIKGVERFYEKNQFFD